MTTKPSTIVIEVGKVYSIGLAFSSSLTDPSPIPGLSPVNGWFIMDVVQPVRRDGSGSTSMRNVRSIRRHLGLVLQYDGSSHRAVILLGTSRPQGGIHCFIPWHGILKLAFQTREVFFPNPRDAFVGHPGYLNFTHAICVTVMQSDEFMACIVHALAFITEVPLVHESITILRQFMERLRRLHSSYWEGRRYSEDGSFDGGSYFSDDGDDLDHRHALSGLPLAPLEHSVRANGTSVSHAHDPMDPEFGLHLSTRVAIAMRLEHRRATQVELMDALIDLVDLPAPSVCCFMEPFTTASLHEVL
jgi:hypothetical protein